MREGQVDDSIAQRRPRLNAKSSTLVFSTPTKAEFSLLIDSLFSFMNKKGKDRALLISNFAV
jgi:hypothetical protein